MGYGTGKTRPLAFATDTVDVSGSSVAVTSGVPELTVVNAIDQTSFDLNAAPFSATTNISNDYRLSRVEFNFTTTALRTITITTTDGTVLYKTVNDTSTSISIDGEKQGFNGGENITVAVTQTGSACSMDCVLTVEQGSASLGGNPVLGAGSNAIGSVTVTPTDDYSNDAFGRKRVAGIGNRFDVEFIYGKQENIMDEVVAGGGTVTHNANARDLTLATNGATTGDYAGMYSYDVPYTPGASQLVAITGVLDLAAIGSGTAQVFVRSSVSGSAVETTVDQADWDTPSLDVDWTTSQIFEMDFQSLKVGRIRFYLNRSGVVTQVHEILNDNVRNTGYWQLPNLPVYWRIYNDATYTYMEVGYGDTANAIGFRYRIAVNASATMKAICATVKSEGGLPLFDIPGFNRAADRGVTAKTVSTTIVPLLSIRAKGTYKSLTNQALVLPLEFTVQTDNPIKVILMYNATLTGASWSDVDTAESVVEYDTSATTYSNGHIVHTEYVATSKNTNNSTANQLGRVLIWRRRGTETGIFTIAAVRSSSTNASVLVSLKWRELR